MKIVFHEKYKNSDYAANPAAAPGRIESILDELKRISNLDWIEPNSVDKKTLALIHSKNHIEKIKNQNRLLYEMATLAAGGAVKSGELAYGGDPAFGLIRPPGHHASPGSAWGFCYFNNMSIAIEKLHKENKIDTAYILDFDLHTGDGNINCIGKNPDIKIHNPRAGDSDNYLDEVSRRFEEADDYDIIGVSAGFDEHIEDWGGKLSTDDYREIGKMVKEFAENKCQGRRFAILEGGYNHEVLGENVASFVNGMKD